MTQVWNVGDPSLALHAASLLSGEVLAEEMRESLTEFLVFHQRAPGAWVHVNHHRTRCWSKSRFRFLEKNKKTSVGIQIHVNDSGHSFATCMMTNSPTRIAANPIKNRMNENILWALPFDMIFLDGFCSVRRVGDRFRHRGRWTALGHLFFHKFSAAGVSHHLVGSGSFLGHGQFRAVRKGMSAPGYRLL